MVPVPIRTAAALVEALRSVATEAELPTIRRRLGPEEPALGARMRDPFRHARAARDLPPAAIGVTHIARVHQPSRVTSSAGPDVEGL